MTLVVDAGALVALERNDRSMWRRIRAELDTGNTPLTHAGVVGQIWRGGSGRQANLARALDGIAIVPLDDALGRRAGMLLGRAAMHDVVDAALVELAQDDDRIVTSDPVDIQRLVDASARHVDVIPA